MYYFAISRGVGGGEGAEGGGCGRGRSDEVWRWREE